MTYLHIPTQTFFGEGSLQQLHEVGRSYHNIMVICTRSLPKEHIEYAQSALGDSLESFHGGVLAGEPNSREVNGLISEKTARTDCVIGIGGGSYLDAAKAIAVREEQIEKFQDGRSAVLPIVAVPTTAGTGSELSKGAIIRFGDIKRSVRSELLLPRVAIVDPILCQSLPIEHTRYTGFDIFCHAVETYTSTQSNEFTRLLSLESLSIVMNSLPRALGEFREHGSPRLETRRELSYAAMLQGITLAHASTCLPHRIQYAMSVVSDVSHPRGLAAIYRAWLTHARPQVKAWGPDYLKRFMDNCEITLSLRDVGIHASQLDKVASSIEGRLDFDPSFKDAKTIHSILEASL